MKNNHLLSSNRLIRKSVMRMFPVCFAASICGTMSLLVDSLLAGSMISQLAIAAVAIGNPVTGVFRALIQSFSSGASARLTIQIGRGNREGSNRAYSLGLIATLTSGIFFVLLTLATADLLVLLFGGSTNVEAASLAALYLRSCSPMIVGSALNLYLMNVLNIYGFQRETFFISVCGAVSNTLLSILFVKMLPAAYAIAGLGLGTTAGSLLQSLLCLLMIRIRRVPQKLKFYRFKFAELLDLLKLGFPTCSNNLVDGLITAAVNNIILAGFKGNAIALSVYAAVKGVFGFAQVPAATTVLSSPPLLGLLYGARDKNGIKRTLRETYKIALLFSVIWCGMLIALLPVLLKFYGIAGNPTLSATVRGGVFTTMLFIPVVLLLRIMTTLFESTEKFSMALAYSIIPDSVIYPLLLMALLPILQYTGIWLAFGANGIVFLIALYLLRSLKNKTLRMNTDRILCLDESVRDNVPRMDISIRSISEDVSAISTQAHRFLIDEGASERTAYMASLCMEELAADFAAHSSEKKHGDQEIMDVKLFSDADRIRIIIRNADKPYNPLDFDLDDTTFAKVGVKMAQKVAQRIEYAYVYRLNIITIDLAK